MSDFGPIYIRADPSGKCVRLGLIGSKIDMNPQTAREFIAKMEQVIECVEENSRAREKAATFNPYLESKGDPNERQTAWIKE